MAIKTRSSGRVSNGDWSATSAGSGGSAARTTPASKKAAGLGLALIGLLAILDGAWGGIVPYLGPTFGYSSNGLGSFEWTTMHSLLYLVPGAVAVFAGSCLLTLRRNSSLFGLLLALCGAWLVVGVIAWPTLYSGLTVFTSAPPDTLFVNILGYNLGPGVILAVLGGMALGARGRA